jgi:hypothetical protein
MLYIGHRNKIKYHFDKKIISELRRLELNKFFMADFDYLKGNWHQIVYDENDDVLGVDCFLCDETLTIFNKGVNNLRKKYNLDISYHVPLCTWMIYGDPESSSYSADNILWHRTLCGSEDRDGEKIFTIYIYPETTMKDIQETWPDIKKQKETFYNYKPKRTVMRRNIERDVNVVQLRKQGKKAKEIVKIINREFPQQPITYEYVSLLIKRAKK